MSKAEQRHKDAVARLGCIVCRNLGKGHSPAEIHHVRFNQGLSQRASDFEVLPLCYLHHNAGIHGVSFHAGRRTWEAEYGTEAELLEQVRVLLGTD